MMRTTLMRTSLFVECCFFLSMALRGTLGAAEAKLTPAAVFANHAVIQRDMEVPVWGTAAPDERITIKFRGQEASATADTAGKWLVRLKAMKAEVDQKPTDLVIEGKSKTIVLNDILVGEVWVGSGQSNMALPVSFYIKGDEVLAAMAAHGPYPNLRLFDGRWGESTPENAKRFSGLLFPFGLSLQKELGVPVGLISAACNSSSSGRWLSQDSFKADESCQELTKKQIPLYEAALKKYRDDLAKWETSAATAKQAGTTVPNKPNAPRKPGQDGDGDLYKAHIRKLIPFGIRGVLWDQGESGTDIPGVDQYTLMGALIRGWRREWGQGDFPFLYVQKPSGGGCAWDRTDPVTRMAEAFTQLPTTVPKATPLTKGQPMEHYLRIMGYPNTGMVISSDLGGSDDDVHPPNKSGYGRRACDVALGMVYGRPVEYLGPVYDSHIVYGAAVRIRFKHVGKGLAFKHADALQGFAIAGEDRVFHWAAATIDGANVVVRSEKVTQPQAVRYAWAYKRNWANLFNKDGLPAVPFRTDTW